MCMCIFSHTFYCCLNVCLHVGLLLFCGVFLISFFHSSAFFLPFFFFITLILNILKPSIFFLHLFLCLSFLLFFSPCSLYLVYINLLHLPLFNFAYQFLLSFLSFLSSQHMLVLFSLLSSPLGTLFYFCFQAFALVSFILVDIIFGFLCSLGQSIVRYFWWTILTLLMDVYVYIQLHFSLLL